MSVTWVAPNKNTGGLIAVTVIMVGAYVLLLLVNWRSDVQIHTLLEFSSTLIALCVSALAFVRYYSMRQVLFLFVGTGFFGAGLLDGYHTLVTSTYIQALMPSSLSHLTPWSWLASRLFMSIMMFMTVLSLTSKKPGFHEAFAEPGRVYGFAALFTVLSFILFTVFPLPPAQYPEFIFHRPADIIPGFLFLVAFIYLIKEDKWHQDTFQTTLVYALVFDVFAQFVCMPLSTMLFDISFDMAHFLKLASYIVIGTGLLINILEVLHRERNQSRVLEQRNQELEKSKAWLEEQIKLRREAEEKLKEREKNLMRSNEELEMFAFLASHDLQEPLRKIQAFSDRLLATQQSQLSDKGKDYLRRMQSASERMQTLINDLLAFSRVTSRAGAFKPTNLNALLDQILSDISVTIEEKQATITVGPLDQMNTDPVQMRQLFQNLICNGLKYQAPDQKPVLHIWGEQRVSKTPDGSAQSFYDIHIEDNGIGIDQEHQNQIFQMFTRLHGRDTYKGSGVGLSIARKIARRHGGDISVTSTPGKGSRFTVSLKWGLVPSATQFQESAE